VDLHLHPLWQRELRNFIDTKLPNFQIICTTHSPLTAQQSADGELYFLRRPTPLAPIQLHRYAGAPRDLMLHQVLLGPAFGLDTMDSKRVEDMKVEYRKLDNKAQLTSQEQKRMRVLRDALVDMPEWSTETAADRKRLRLLTKLEKRLNGDADKSFHGYGIR